VAYGRRLFGLAGDPKQRRRGEEKKSRNRNERPKRPAFPLHRPGVVPLHDEGRTKTASCSDAIAEFLLRHDLEINWDKIFTAAYSGLSGRDKPQARPARSPKRGRAERGQAIDQAMAEPRKTRGPNPVRQTGHRGAGREKLGKTGSSSWGARRRNRTFVEHSFFFFLPEYKDTGLEQHRLLRGSNRGPGSGVSWWLALTTIFFFFDKPWPEDAPLYRRKEMRHSETEARRCAKEGLGRRGRRRAEVE